MRLTDLAHVLSPRAIAGGLDRVVAGVHHDSRAVGPDDVFVAIPGTTVDGRRFVPELNCAAVITEGPVEAQTGVTVFTVADARLALAQAAAALHGDPARSLPVIGITGTNGKTTTALMLEAIVTASGHTAGIIGTTGHRIAGRPIAATHTTPEAPVLQGLLAAARDAHCALVAMEVSSIGLTLRRADAIPFQVAAFTSFSQDHLDFHGTMGAYLDAKLRLLTELLDEGGTAVLHDQLPARVLNAALGDRRRWLVGTTPQADLRLLSAAHTVQGAQARIAWQGEEHALRLPIVGAHNVENALVAIGCALALDVPMPAILAGLAGLSPIPGRLERVDTSPGDSGSAFNVFVDFAHTPDALTQVLATLAPLCSGRLIVVFGCGGDRDAGKRPLMGAAAEAGASLVVLTSDNPRSEDPLVILDQIRAGMTSAPHVEPDREAAIRWALDQAAPGDLVLIAGKGHEATQTIGDEKRPFHDPTVAARLLAERGAR
jgi:UDP-N-acetylmuramyl-tripeptide synthetase